MTSTNNCIGIENVSKPTSRVLAPPGGKANFVLGGYGEDTAPAARKPSSEQVEAEKLQAQKQAQNDLYKPSPPQPIRPAVGHNPVTGEPNRSGPPEPAAVPEPTASGRRAKPPKIDPASMPAAGGRVENKAAIKRQPPGGKDSGIFGE